MIDANSAIFQTISKQLDACGILAVGELHGVRENYALYEELINKLAISRVAIELRPEYLSPVMRGDTSIIPPTHINDGRLSHDLLDFFSSVKSSVNLDEVICFDTSKSDMNLQAREDEYAKSFLRIYDANPQPTLLIAGNLHTQKTPINPNESAKTDTPLKPMLHLLEKSLDINILTIKLEYARGQFFNFGVQDIALTRPRSKTCQLEIKDQRSCSYIFTIPHASAVRV